MDTMLLNPRNFQNMCRLCLYESGGIYIFENCFLPDSIFSITGIKVQHLDKFPNNLCTNCFKIIQLTIDFRKSVTKCQKILFDLVKTHTNTELTASNESSEQGTKGNSLVGEEGINKSIIRVRDDLYSNQSTNVTEFEKEPGMNIEGCRLNSVIHSNTLGDKEKEPIQSLVSNIQNNDILNASVDKSETSVELSIKKEPKDKFNKDTSHNAKQNYKISSRPLIEIINGESEEHNLRTECLTKRNFKKDNEQRDVGDVIAEGNVRETNNISKKIKFEEDATYQCDSCSKFFMTWKKLYCHKRIHNKVYQCPGCDKKFATNGDLQKHSRTHTGDRPFACTICSKRFTQKAQLKSHKQTIHGIKLETMSDEQLRNKVLWGD